MDGEGPMPYALYIGRLCEAFNCRPSEAIEEAEQFPEDFLEEILEARAFADTKRLVDRTKKKEHLPDTPMVQLVKDVTEELVLEEIERKRKTDANTDL